MEKRICWESDGTLLKKINPTEEQWASFTDLAKDYKYAVLHRRIEEDDDYNLIGIESRNDIVDISSTDMVIRNGELIGFYPFTDHKEDEGFMKDVLEIAKPDQEVSEQKVYGFREHLFGEEPQYHDNHGNIHFVGTYTFRLKKKD